MNTMILFVHMCMILDTQRCVSHKEVVYTDLLPTMCAAKAQARAAELYNQHPGYVVTKYGCRREHVAARSS